ncbi:MAG: glycosyltransferase [Methanococci archaeon]|nr:glycosyltransferase [Methanococci archaeon]
MGRKTLVILLPALNEEETIGKVIDEIDFDSLRNMGFDVKVVVANGPSTDNTEKVAKEKGAIVYNIPIKGKGNQIRETLKRIDFHYDYLVMLDSDYTYPCEYINTIVKLLENGDCDVVIGSRLKGRIEEGAMSKVNMFGNWCLTMMASLLYFKYISDVCTGMWGFKKYVLDSIKIDAEGFDLEANFFVEIVKKGFKIKEIPIHYRPRPNESKLSGGSRFKAISNGLKIGWYLVKKRF